ncbi:MAG: 2-oxoacid:acceptor oxidoreductase family protein [Thermoplasmata archaeon]
MTDIRFAGFGGQGIILMGIAVARAAALYDVIKDANGERTRFATQTQSYGPSARGGHSRCDVKISDEEIHYPFIEKPDILVVMSEQAYRKYSDEFNADGLMILDSDLVRENPSCRNFRIPATKVAEEELGTRVVANMVMLGAFQEITGAVSWDALQKAVLEMVPKPTHELNKKALERGRELAREIAGKCKPGDRQ